MTTTTETTKFVVQEIKVTDPEQANLSLMHPYLLVDELHGLVFGLENGKEHVCTFPGFEFKIQNESEVQKTTKDSETKAQCGYWRCAAEISDIKDTEKKQVFVAFREALVEKLIAIKGSGGSVFNEVIKVSLFKGLLLKAVLEKDVNTAKTEQKSKNIASAFFAHEQWIDFITRPQHLPLFNDHGWFWDADKEIELAYDKLKELKCPGNNGENSQKSFWKQIQAVFSRIISYLKQLFSKKEGKSEEFHKHFYTFHELTHLKALGFMLRRYSVIGAMKLMIPKPWAITFLISKFLALILILVFIYFEGLHKENIEHESSWLLWIILVLSAGYFIYGFLRIGKEVISNTYKEVVHKICKKVIYKGAYSNRVVRQMLLKMTMPRITVALFGGWILILSTQEFWMMDYDFGFKNPLSEILAVLGLAIVIIIFLYIELSTLAYDRTAFERFLRVGYVVLHGFILSFTMGAFLSGIVYYSMLDKDSFLKEEAERAHTQKIDYHLKKLDEIAGYAHEQHSSCKCNFC